MDVILPLFPAGAFGERASFAVAGITGVAFGFVLERGGLGSSRKLAGQFYGTDFTVFKVMFTAIVTAMLGVFVLSVAGLLDPAQLAVPPTFLLPHLVGGLLFGVGFVMGGLCPGTSCVAAVSGKLDAVMLIVGMLAGTLLFGELFNWLGDFYGATPRGRLTIPSLLHLPDGVVVMLVTAMALACFAGLARFERLRGAAQTARPPLGHQHQE
jgi:uncharacterized membrane protein YedE/YeeE